MGSFKVKLVAYFLLLSLLPLAAAFWGFSTVAARSETRRVDARLQAGLRAALAAYQEALGSADAAAGQLARNPAFQRALLARIARPSNACSAGSRIFQWRLPGGFQVGRRDPKAVTRQVEVLGANGTHGSVVASLPLDDALVRSLETRSGLENYDHVVLIQNGRIVAGPPGVSGSVDVHSGKTRTISLDKHQLPQPRRRHDRGTSQRDARRDQPAGAHRRDQP